MKLELLPPKTHGGKRANSGRKADPDKPAMILYTLRVPPELKTALDLIPDKEMRMRLSKIVNCGESA